MGKERLANLFHSRAKKVFSVYYTAGFPDGEATVPVLSALAESGVDLIELGMPFSDPIADGPTIQAANLRSIEGGITTAKIFEAVAEFRKNWTTPLILMGHVNPVLQFGIEAFLSECVLVGVDGVILPDLPLAEYEENYRSLFERAAIGMIFLVTAETPLERIRAYDELSGGFLYLVSSPAITGGSLAVDDERIRYFSRLREMNLRNALVVGFGIDSPERVASVSQHVDGVIVGSAFVRAVEACSGDTAGVKAFVAMMKGTRQ